MPNTTLPSPFLSRFASASAVVAVEAAVVAASVAEGAVLADESPLSSLPQAASTSRATADRPRSLRPIDPLMTCPLRGPPARGRWGNYPAPCSATRRVLPARPLRLPRPALQGS